MNPVAETLTGWRLEEARDRQIESVLWLVNETTRRRVQNPVAAALADASTETTWIPALLIASSGAEVPVEVRATPLHAQADATRGGVLILRDMSELRRARQVQNRLAAIVQ